VVRANRLPLTCRATAFDVQCVAITDSFDSVRLETERWCFV